MATARTLQVAIILFLLLLPAGLISIPGAVSAEGESAPSTSSSAAITSAQTYGVGLSGAPVILDESTLSSMGGGTVAQDQIVIQEYLVPSAVNLVFLDIGWDNDANTTTTLVAGGYEPWVANWLEASGQYEIDNIFFTKQWGYFFSGPSWDQDVLNEYPSVATVNASGVKVPLSDCAGCTTESGWTVASPLIYRAYEADLKQLYSWYGNYTNWIGFGEGATGDRNYYGSGTSGSIKTSRPFDNFTMDVYANSVFFQRLIDPATGKYLSNGQTSKIWEMFVNDESNVVLSTGVPLVYPQYNQVSGGGRSGNVLLQRFYVPFGESTSDFTIKSYIEKVGSPTGSLYLSIFEDNTSTQNGGPVLQTVLANQTVSGVSSSFTWVSTSFTGVTLVGGDYYWAGYASSSSGTSASDHFEMICDQQNVFSDIYTAVASNGIAHARREAGGSVLWLQSGGKNITIYPYMNVGNNQQGGTAYFQVQSRTKANVVTFFLSDREYDPNNVTLSLEYPNGTVLATTEFSVQLEYGLGTLSYLPLQLSNTVTLVPGIKYQVVASTNSGGPWNGDSYAGSSGVGVTQDYIVETANPAGAGYLGQAAWPVLQLEYMILQPNGVSNYNYLGGTDLFDSPGYIKGSEIALRFEATATESLGEFQVEVIHADSSSSVLQLSLRNDNATVGSHPTSLRGGAALATASVTLSSLNSSFHSGAPTTTGEYVLANFTSFTGSTSLRAGTYYWLVLNVTKNGYVGFERLVEPEHLTYVSTNDYAKTWGPAADGPSDLSFNIITSVQTINNLVLGVAKYQLGNFAQSFESPRVIQLTGLWIPVSVGGSAANVSIHADSGSGSPASNALSFGLIGQNATGGSLNYAGLNPPVNITANAKYWIVVEPTSCISSCSQATSVTFDIYSSAAHSSPVDYGGTTLHYETSSNGITWISPASSSEGDMPFILATSVSTIKTYNTETLYSELVADDAQTSSYPPEGWNQFLNYEQARINYNLTQMISTLSGRTFKWFSGMDTDIIQSIPNFNASYFVTQAVGAGGPIGCPSSDVSCGGVYSYWQGDANEKVNTLLSSLDQSSVLGWSSFGATQDNAGEVTPEDLNQQYLVELPWLATEPLTFNDWCWGLSCHGLDNFTQTAPMRSFGTILNRMAYAGGYFGTSAATVKVLWIYTSDDGAFPSYLTSATAITETSDSNSNLTQFGDLQQFNVIVNPQSIQAMTASAERRIVAFVRNGGGIVETASPASWEYNIMGLSPSSGCCTAPYSILSGNKITAPYASLPGYSPYYPGSFTKESNESAVLEAQDSGGRAVISSNNYFLGRGVYLPQPYARLQYADGGTGSIGDSYVTLMVNAIFYAAHKDGLLPVIWNTAYLGQQPWNQLVYTIDGVPGSPLLWVSTNSTTGSSFDIHLNATYFGLNTSGWLALDVRDMSVVAKGTGSDIHISVNLPPSTWLPIYIVSRPGNFQPVYSTASITGSSISSSGGQYATSGPRNASSWLVLSLASSPLSVTSSKSSEPLPAFSTLSALNSSKIGEYCTSVASGGKCNSFTYMNQQGWYYDSSNSLLYIHFQQGSPATIGVSLSQSSSTTSTETTTSSYRTTTSTTSSSPTSTTSSTTTSTTSSSPTSTTSSTTTSTTSSSQTNTQTSSSMASETTTVTSSTVNQTTSAPPESCEQASSCSLSSFDPTITIQSDAVSPVQIYVDGVTYTTPSSFAWPVGSNHTIVLGELYVNTPTGKSKFVGWSGGANSTSTSTTITVRGDLSLFASYKNQYLVNIAFADAEGRGVSPQNVSIRGPAGAFNLTDSGLWLLSGTYQVTRAEWMGTNVGSNQNVPVTFSVTDSNAIVVPLPIYDETIIVADVYGLPISGAIVTMTVGNQIQQLMTNSTGKAAFKQVPLGYLNGTVKYLAFSGNIRVSTPGEHTEHVIVTLSYPVLITITSMCVVGTYFTVRRIRRKPVRRNHYSWASV